MSGPDDLSSLLTRRQMLTWPNLFTLIRLVCIPVFVWLLFGRHNRAAAAWLLAVLGATDWVDGWLARRFDQMSEFGAVFDPTVDRLLFFVAVPSLIVDGSIPIIIAALALARELLTAALALFAEFRAGHRIVVTWAGKTGAFLLMFAVPMYLGASSTLSYAGVLEPLAWLFAVPGLAYGWYATVFEYLPLVRRLMR
jgi:cardiolipin synthase